MTNKLNIGACSFKKDGWLNLDKPSPHYQVKQAEIDVCHDLMVHEAIQVDSESLVAVYTSHTIEHITDQSVDHLFSEVYRMLEKGGVFRVTCPDIGRCYDAYINKDREYIGHWLANPAGWEEFRSMGLGEQFLFIFASYLSPYCRVKSDSIRTYPEEEISEIFLSKNKADALSYFTDECQLKAAHLQETSPGNHVSWWDFDRLKEKLEATGFSGVTLQSFDKSDFDVFNGFDSLNQDNVTQKDYTVFVECIK